MVSICVSSAPLVSRMKNGELIFIKWVKYGSFTAHYSERGRSWPQFITLKLTVSLSVFLQDFLISGPSLLGQSFSCPSNKVEHPQFCRPALQTENFLSSLVEFLLFASSAQLGTADETAAGLLAHAVAYWAAA